MLVSFDQEPQRLCGHQRHVSGDDDDIALAVR